jgi:benzodiazapine receptor
MKRLVLWLIAAFVPAAIGAPFPAPDYYRRLNKPAWAPPPWIFGPVWTLLYAMIGTSAWLVSRRGGSGTRTALGLWWAQLALNAAWTPIFFGARNRGLALVEILATWVVIVATTIAFFTRRATAGLLLLPYLAWVTFASALSYAVWRDN